MSEEKRVYVVLPKTVRVKPFQWEWNGACMKDYGFERNLEQVPGRQIAQACHVVSKLRQEMCRGFSSWGWKPITTIILEARNQKEMMHLFTCLTGEGKQPTLFQDENEAVYGSVKPITAMAVYAMPLEVENTLGYLPLWGAQ